MDSAIQLLTRTLLDKNAFEDCSFADLQSLAKQYPYFVPAQLLYAQKLKDTNTVLYHQQLQKTSLYFQNPFWLQHILANDKKINDESVIEAALVKEEIIKEPEISTAPEKEAVEEPIVPDAISNPITEEAFTELKPEEVITDASPISEGNKPVTEPEKLEERVFEEYSEESSGISEKSMAMLAAAKLKLNEPVAEDAPLFEALHTVDYFASQGIKLSQEAIPKDKFGQQLKSFTEWLKAMKRIPQSEVVKAINTAEPDKKVEELAEHSLDQAEILTETMAEVWAKQGNNTKAIEVYEKLSLQNPAKSHYFAGLIEQLRKN
jgi:hypothetical protein